MHRDGVLLLLLILAACSAEPPITDVPFYTATAANESSADGQFAGTDLPLEFIGGNPEILSTGGNFSFAVSGALISQQEMGTIIYSYLPQFDAIPAHDQLYISASDADSSEQISFEFSANLPVGQYPLIAPSDFIMGTVSAQYQRLVANETGTGLETYNEEISGFLNLTAAGVSLSGNFQFTAAYIQRSPEGEIQTQRVEVTGEFSDVPYREVGDDPFESIVPLLTRVFTGTEVPVSTEQP
jgi:hypothetical protein